MKCVRKVDKNLYWVGSEDLKINLYENRFPIPRGISYNSYLLIDKKVVLFDLVWQSAENQFFENIDAVLGGRSIDYLVITHMETDYTSILQELILKFPKMKILVNDQLKELEKQFFAFDVEEKVKVVNEKDTLNTGEHELQFFAVPTVHFPEIMVTYEKKTKTLFSADLFGNFGALGGNLFTSDINIEKDYMDEARRYYGNLLGKYGSQIQTLLCKLSNIKIKRICPIHGPIWKDNIDIIMNKYKKWSKWEAEEKAVMLVYSSIYGHTENVINVLANYLAEHNIKNIKVFDVSHIDTSYLIAETFRCSHIVIANVLYNMKVFPKLQEYITYFSMVRLKNRTISLINNSTVVPVEEKLIKGQFENIEGIKILEKEIKIKSSMKEEDAIQIKKFGNDIIKDLNI